MELYGTDDVPKIPKEVADARISLLKEHLSLILSNGVMNADSHRVKKILQAIKFWETMREGEENHE